jgi:hypothetical protein
MSLPTIDELVAVYDAAYQSVECYPTLRSNPCHNHAIAAVVAAWTEALAQEAGSLEMPRREPSGLIAGIRIGPTLADWLRSQKPEGTR